MKASDLTIEGHYWYRNPDNGGWSVVYFNGPDDEYPFHHIGNEQPYGAEDMDGEFVGPLANPGG